MATAKTDAQKVAEYRKIAADTKQPPEVRDQADKRANEIEAKSVEKATGMKLAKGGAVAKAKAPMKAAAKQPMKGPAVVVAVGVAKPKAKALAKGGMAKKGKC